jgi:SAM-dependent methyltransferase
VPWSPPSELVPDVAGALPFLNTAIVRQRDAALNVEGGDVGGHGSPVLVARHVCNYQAAVEVVRASSVPVGRMLDVGCGVGALAAWAASTAGRELTLCDQDAAVVRFGGETFGVDSVTDLADAPTAAVVTAMEVLEHVPPQAQRSFVAGLWDRVEPGGVLVMSTPDESRYPGGWSGYAPHVGVLDPAGLHALLTEVTGAEVQVVRLDGGPYEVPAGRRWLERILNGTWNGVRRLVPGLAARLASRAGRAEPLDLDHLLPAATPVRVVPTSQGTGVGMLAVAFRR